MDNPFVLAFGEVPPVMLDITSKTTVITSDLLAERPNLRNFMISGVRGSGKTVLLRAVEKELSDKEDFIFVNLDMGEGDGRTLLNQFAARLANIPGMKMLYTKAEVALSVLGGEIVLSNENAYFDIRLEIEKMLKVLSKKNKKIVITLDEVANTSGVRSFASAYKEISGQEYPVYLIMAGLKENTDSLKNEKTLTFLRRTFPIELDGLNYTSIIEEYMKRLKISREKAQQLANMTKRYSFAFQALGFSYIAYGEDWLKHYDYLLASYVYRPLWDSLSEKDKTILMGINKAKPKDNGQREMKDILNSCNLKNNAVTPYIKRLKNATILTSKEYGSIEYNYPRFEEFLAFIEAEYGF